MGRVFLGLILVCVLAHAGLADTVFVNNQTFSIGVGATAPLPANWKADKLTTVRTVGTYSAAGTSTDQRNGNLMSSSAANGIYNYGAGLTTTATDRAVGFLSSSGGTQSGNLYTTFISGASALDSFQVTYDVEKYRNGMNAAGFRFQLYYSLDGSVWTDAGGDFLTSFAGDANNNGFATAPGSTTNVNKTLSVSVPANTQFYLAWNYSVTSGLITTNAQGLGIDNVTVSGHDAPVTVVPLPLGVFAGLGLIGFVGVRQIRRRETE
jgi:hypothetical protein